MGLRKKVNIPGNNGNFPRVISLVLNWFSWFLLNWRIFKGGFDSFNSFKGGNSFKGDFKNC